MGLTARSSIEFKFKRLKNNQKAQTALSGTLGFFILTINYVFF